MVRRRSSRGREECFHEFWIDPVDALSPSARPAVGPSFRHHETCDLRADDIRRVDVCLTTAGLHIVDYIRGADFSARRLVLSLQTGEPRPVAKALAWEAAGSLCGGPAHRPRSDRLFAKAEALARQLDEPNTNPTRMTAMYAPGFPDYRAGNKRGSSPRSWDCRYQSVYGRRCRLPQRSQGRSTENFQVTPAWSPDPSEQPRT
jgi:hypothetical protein